MCPLSQWAIPSNLILQKSPPALYLAFNIFMCESSVHLLSLGPLDLPTAKASAGNRYVLLILCTDIVPLPPAISQGVSCS